MQAIRCHAPGGVDVIQEDTIAAPHATATQVVIQTEWAGVNYIDIYFRTGLYPAEMPMVFGRECGGTVVEVGAEVHDMAVGDRVVALTSDAFAQRVAADRAMVAKVPAHVELRAATAIFLQGLTAIALTHTAYDVRPGDWVLIHAAAGGTGLMLVDVCKARGAHVIGTTSSEAKAAVVREHGADHCLVYGDGIDPMDVADRVLALTEGQGVHVVYDSVGQATWASDFKAVRRLGTLVSFGQSSGTPAPLQLAQLSPKNLKVLRPTLFNYIVTAEEMAFYADRLFAYFPNTLSANVWRVYPFGAAGVQQAQRDLSSRTTSGKLLIEFPTCT